MEYSFRIDDYGSLWTSVGVVGGLASLAFYRSYNRTSSKGSKDSLAPWPPSGLPFADFIDVARPLRWVHHQKEWIQKYGLVFRVPSPFPLLIPEQVLIGDAAVAKELLTQHANQNRPPVKFTTRPPQVSRVILKAEGYGVTGLIGEEWKWRKHALLKEFHNARLKETDRQLLPVIFDVAKSLCDEMEKAADSKTPLEVDIHTVRLAVEVIYYVLFGRRAGDRVDAEAFRRAGHTMVRFVPHQLFHPWHGISKWIPGTKCYRAQKEKDNAWKTIDAVIENEIDTILREFRQEIPVDPNRKPGCTVASLLEKEPRYRVHKDRLVEELRPLVLAGFETTAHALAFAIGHLAEFPCIAAQIANEGQKAGLRANGKTMDITTVDRKILDACPTALYFFQETLRMFPPVNTLAGECLRDCQVTDSHGNTFGLRKGTNALFLNYAMQRACCKNGDDFDPQRWNYSQEQEASLPFLNAFFNGPHVCPGKNIALLEGQIVVLMAACHFTFEFVGQEDAKVTLDPKSDVFSLPKDGMRLQVHRRK